VPDAGQKKFNSRPLAPSVSASRFRQMLNDLFMFMLGKKLLCLFLEFMECDLDQ